MDPTRVIIYAALALGAVLTIAEVTKRAAARAVRDQITMALGPNPDPALVRAATAAGQAFANAAPTTALVRLKLASL